ncbi:MAG: hypothetical protein RBT19_14540 [Tenuifilaceae bacterium]|jgi:hypothetical protein|nr:hypothetical protein [Tenuifilaceae bacterium]
MKTTTIFNKTHRLQITLILAGLISLASLPATAQNAWPTGEEKGSVTLVKGKNTTFRCKINTNAMKRKRFFIKNTSFGNPMEGRKEHSNRYDEYSVVKLVSHDSVINAIRKSFPGGRLAELVAADEEFSLSIYIDEQGEVISLNYSLEFGTSILPTEIEGLEKNLLNALEFTIEGKRFDSPTVYSAYIVVKFPEVEQGEIRILRNLELQGIL